MGKLRLSVHRKNEQRKKYGVLYRVRVPRDIVSIMPVSIPLDVLPYRVSLPLSSFSASPVCSISTLRKRTLEMNCCHKVIGLYNNSVTVHIMLIHVVCALLFHTGWIETLGDSDVHRLDPLNSCSAD